MARPCDRCKAGDYDDEITQCAEYSFASGLLAWLCIDCRASWLEIYMSNNNLRLKYEKLIMKIDWLQLKLENHNDVSMEDGLRLLEERFQIEAELRALGKKWLRHDD